MLRRKPATGLPTPDDRPGTDVVIYDGRCRLCTAICRILNRVDDDRLTFLSLDDEQVAKGYPDLWTEELLKHVYVVDRRGRRHRGAGAVRYLTRRLPALWPLMPLLHVQGSLPVWQVLYHWVSQHRRRL